LTLGAKSLVAYGETLGTLDARANYQGDQLDVTSLELGSLRATATYNTATHRYRADAHAQDFKTSRGSVTLDASGEGTTENPAGQVKLAIDHLQWEDQQYG